MSLGTCGADGQPAVRIVLLHGFDARGFTFYTNYESRKGRDIAANPRAALTFYWPWLDEQVRAEGTLARDRARGIGRLLRDAASAAASSARGRRRRASRSRHARR